MASFVARKLVENGQTRILQRIYEGITSDWPLAVSDAKSSTEHQLIHLVWRKFPRNHHFMEDLHPTVSTQTEEASGSSLGLAASADLTGPLPKLTISDSTQTTEDMRPGPKHISRNYVASVSDCFSQSDLNELFDKNVSPLESDADWTSDGSTPSSDLSQDFSIPFKKPARRRSGKPSCHVKKFQLRLSNRFDGLEEVLSKVKNPSKFLNEEERGVDSHSSDGSWETDPCETPTTSKSNHDMKISYETQLRQLKASINTNNKPSPENIFFDSTPPVSAAVSTPEVKFAPDQASSNTYDQERNSSKLRRQGVVKWFDTSKMSYGFITMDDKVVFFHANNVHKERNYTPSPGDRVTFFLDEYDRGAIDIKRMTNVEIFNDGLTRRF